MHLLLESTQLNPIYASAISQRQHLRDHTNGKKTHHLQQQKSKGFEQARFHDPGRIDNHSIALPDPTVRYADGPVLMDEDMPVEQPVNSHSQFADDQPVGQEPHQVRRRRRRRTRGGSHSPPEVKKPSPRQVGNRRRRNSQPAGGFEIAEPVFVKPGSPPMSNCAKSRYRPAVAEDLDRLSEVLTIRSILLQRCKYVLTLHMHPDNNKEMQLLNLIKKLSDDEIEFLNTNNDCFEEVIDLLQAHMMLSVTSVQSFCRLFKNYLEQSGELDTTLFDAIQRRIKCCKELNSQFML